jgi:hypothetical protein
MVASLSDTRLDNRTLVVQALLGPTERIGQLDAIMAAEIAQFDAFEIVPDALVSIEVGRIARQPLQLEARGGAPAQEVLDGLPRWMSEPSQITRSLQRIVRSSTRRKRTTSGER